MNLNSRKSKKQNGNEQWNRKDILDGHEVAKKEEEEKRLATMCDHVGTTLFARWLQSLREHLISTKHDYGHSYPMPTSGWWESRPTGFTFALCHWKGAQSTQNDWKALRHANIWHTSNCFNNLKNFTNSLAGLNIVKECLFLAIATMKITSNSTLISGIAIAHSKFVRCRFTRYIPFIDT